MADTRRTIVSCSNITGLSLTRLLGLKPEQLSDEDIAPPQIMLFLLLPPGPAPGLLLLNQYVRHPEHAHPSVPTAIDINRNFRTWKSRQRGRAE